MVLLYGARDLGFRRGIRCSIRACGVSKMLPAVGARDARPCRIVNVRASRSTLAFQTEF